MSSPAVSHGVPVSTVKQLLCDQGSQPLRGWSTHPLSPFWKLLQGCESIPLLAKPHIIREASLLAGGNRQPLTAF